MAGGLFLYELYRRHGESDPAEREWNPGVVIYVLFAITGAAAVFLVIVNLMATVALVRTDSLTGFQKVAQGFIVWVFPVAGALLVLHLIGQSDGRAIPKWISDPEINQYVFQLLGIEGKAAERAAEHVVEQALVHGISEHVSDAGGGESAGADGH
jgi:hypothetical protein